MCKRRLSVVGLCVAVSLVAFGCEGVPQDAGIAVTDASSQDTSPGEFGVGEGADESLVRDEDDNALSGPACQFDYECDALIETSACQIAFCDNGTCAETLRPDGSACDDANACTEEGTCSEGVCVPGDDVVCFSNNPCIIDGCDPESGCTATNSSEACDDGSDCTLDDVCFAG